LEEGWRRVARPNYPHRKPPAQTPRVDLLRIVRIVFLLYLKPTIKKMINTL
jgi:hypothetical protein